MNIGWKYRIYPTKEQQEKIIRNIDGAKSVYNAALYARTEDYKQQVVRKASALGIELLYKDGELDMSDKAQMEYRNALIIKTCEKYGIEPCMKESKDGNTSYLDVTKTKRAIITKIYDTNAWEYPLTDKGSPDYKAMRNRCSEEGYSFEFEISTTPVSVAYFTHGENAEYYKQLDSVAISGALRNLNAAYERFYNNLSKGITEGFPKYKRRGLRNKETNLPNPLNVTGSYQTKATNSDKGFIFEPFTKEDSSLSQKYEYVKLLKLGKVKMRLHRPFPDGAKISKYANVSRDTSGAFYIVFNIEMPDEDTDRALSIDSMIGYELSIGDSIIFSSTGKTYDTLQGCEELENKLAYKQQSLDFMKKGSNNWHKKQYEIQRLHAKITRIRKAQIDLIAEDIVKSSDYICFRDVNVKELQKKPVEIDDITLRTEGKAIPKISKADKEKIRKYYRSERENHSTGINDKLTFLAMARRAYQKQAWSTIVEEVEKKAKRDKKIVLKTSKYALTTQRCSCCGDINEDMGGIENIGKKDFCCKKCGYESHRDINSALNIKELCAEAI